MQDLGYHSRSRRKRRLNNQEESDFVISDGKLKQVEASASENSSPK